MSGRIWSTPCVKCNNPITEGQIILLIKLGTGDYGTIHHVCPETAAEFEQAIRKFTDSTRAWQDGIVKKQSAPSTPSRLRQALRLLSGRRQ